MLLSGSQDATIKLWDTRGSTQPILVVRDTAKFALRDAVFSTLIPSWFAAAFDDGSVQVFDERKLSGALWTKRAHGSGAYAIDWHPTRKDILASVGRDRFIHIWDVHKNELVSTIKTVSPASRIAWRKRHYPSTQIAVNSVAGSADSPADFDTRVTVWDTRFPNLPARLLSGNRSVVTDLLWSPSSKSVYTSSKDGTLAKLRFRSGGRPYRTLPSTALAVHPSNGTIAFSHDEVRRDVGLDSANAKMSSKSETPFARLLPQSPWGKVCFANSSAFALDKNVIIALAEAYKLSGDSPETCEYNEEVAAKAGHSKASAVWRILAQLEREVPYPFIENVRRGFLLDATKSLSEAGDTQTSTVLACLLRHQATMPLHKADHILRSAHAYVDLLRRFQREDLASRTATAFGLAA